MGFYDSGACTFAPSFPDKILDYFLDKVVAIAYPASDTHARHSVRDVPARENSILKPFINIIITVNSC